MSDLICYKVEVSVSVVSTAEGGGGGGGWGAEFCSAFSEIFYIKKKTNSKLR